MDHSTLVTELWCYEELWVLLLQVCEAMLVLRRLSQMWGSWYLPPSRFNVGFLTRIWIASRTPLLNQFGSLLRMRTFSKLTLWPGQVVFMCLDTSDDVALGLRCSWNRALRGRSVSPIYDWSQCSPSLPWHSIMYTGPHISSFLDRSFGAHSSCRRVFWGFM